ncbi:MAG: sugar transferase [Bacteroidales bacterium]|nr:sugar transferase [Bacteroidales bacterium]
MLKRIFDIAASLFGLIVLSPALLIIAVLIKIRMPGPALFSQQRTGRYGKLFTIYKFRSMTLDHGGSTISVKGEMRITPLGGTLRKYKLDELPELWNILTGHMSFVGPRPDVPEYTDRLVGEERQILELRPGLTGPATLVYANEEEHLASVEDPQAYNDQVLWPEKVRLNMDYYHNRTFFGDILIIFRTIFR